MEAAGRRSTSWISRRRREGTSAPRTRTPATTPLVSEKCSDQAEVEQVALRIDGEADSLQEALIAEKVPALPIRTQKRDNLEIEAFPLQHFESDLTAVEGATKIPKTSAQHDRP